MAHVVFLRGINVGGRRTFRPTLLARQLRHLDAVNIGAAGTFVIRKRTRRAKLRAEIAERLPFESTIAICAGREIARLMTQDPFADFPERSEIVRFVSVLSQPAGRAPRLPISLPDEGEWLVKVLGCDPRFVFGLHRRRMKVIGFLGKLDGIFGAPVVTRGWNTITAVARALQEGE